MAKNRQVIMRQTITIAATLAVAFSLFYSVMLNSALSKAINCSYQLAVKEGGCMDICCAGTEASPNCCCYFSEMPVQDDSIIIYEPFGKSVYSYMCAAYKFDNSNFLELYNVNCEEKGNQQYIAFKLFRPPKA
jgi:hypothetical protein